MRLITSLHPSRGLPPPSGTVGLEMVTMRSISANWYFAAFATKIRANQLYLFGELA